MGVRDLQDFLEVNCQSACKPVDLLKIARTYQAKRRGKNSGRLRLVVDAESCLDRLYGGFYSDWACGGQWNRMTHFLGILIQACQSTNMELVVFFNGAAETERLTEWAEQMVADKKKVASVLKHIHHKATPPPKVWWIAPVSLRQCLRMVLRQMGVAVACSMDDHHQEVIAYCRENNFHGIVAQDADYAIFDPPRYFSSHNLKLTYRQALETKEYVMDEVAQQLDLNPKRFCVLAALLGNHILTESDLKSFFDSIAVPGSKSQTDRIKAVAGYVRALKSEHDLDEIGKDVFKNSTGGTAALVSKLKKSVQYYLNGTQDGFLNYKPKAVVSTSIKQPGSYPGKPVQTSEKSTKQGSDGTDGEPETELKDSEVKDSEVKDSEVKDSQVKDSKVKDSAVKFSEVKDSEVKDSEVKDSEVKESEVKESEVKESEVTDSEVKESEVKESEVKESEVKESEVTDCEVTDCEVKDSEVKDCEVKDCEVKDCEVKDSEVKDSEVKDSEVKDSEVKDSEVKDSEVKDSQVKDSQVKDTEEVAGDKANPDDQSSEGAPAKVMVNGEQDKHEEKPAEEEEAEEEKEDHEEEFKDLKADSVYTDTESGYANPEGTPAPSIVIDPPSSPPTDLVAEMDSLVLEDSEPTEDEEEEAKGLEKGQKEAQEKKPEQSKNLEEAKVSSVSSASSSSSSTPALQSSPSPDPVDKSKVPNQKNKNRSGPDSKVPLVAPEIMRIASERHQKGLMAPWIYQILSQCEIKLGVTMEDESSRELPTAVELFRPIRQCIYAILFDMNKRRPTGKPNNNGANKEVTIKEWIVPRGSSVPRADLVKARPLEWKVPTVRRLWLGQAIEDKNRRLRAFLSCMKADSPRMLNTSYVPQHLLIMACVLRYMVLNKDVRVLRRHELDAFLCASVSPLLHDVETMQEMKLPMITSRGVQLAALFMRGVETAIFANDACGAPIPWSMCCPWLFFDGKLFHFKLLKANNNTALLDICDGHMEQMMRVERMRGAILEGIPPDTLFAKPGLPLMQPPQYGAGPYYHPQPNMAFRPAGSSANMMGGMMSGPPIERTAGRGRGLLGRSPVDSRGGQLQIAGVVVGNWGPNVQAHQTRPGHRGGSGSNNVAPPHVTAVGPRRGAGSMRGGVSGGRGLMRVGATGMSTRPGSAGRGYNTRGQTGMPRSNITAVKSGIRGSMAPMRGSNPNMTRGKARIKGPAGYNPNKVTVEQRTKVGLAGRGRGMTVENPIDVVSVSQLMKPRMEAGQGDDRDFGQFMDATEPVKHAEVKVNLDDDLGLADESTL